MEACSCIALLNLSQRRLCFFFNDTATTEIYTLSLHDALPISFAHHQRGSTTEALSIAIDFHVRSEEHTSELQSRQYLVCRLLLEKKKKQGMCEQVEAQFKIITIAIRTVAQG